MNRLRSNAEAPEVRLPRPPVAAPQPAAFAACPPGGWGSLTDWQRQVYELALAQAQAVVTPSLPERDLAGVWN